VLVVVAVERHQPLEQEEQEAAALERLALALQLLVQQTLAAGVVVVERTAPLLVALAL
jgi:hypothetical protein